MIGITACLKQGEFAPYHHVQNRYVDAVARGCHAIPVILPALGEATDVEGVLDRLDGLLLTGSPSNVSPSYYDGPPAREGNLADPVRDATTLPLIRRAVARGVPLLAICRGIQELNVALGGSLHQHVHEVDGRRDHRSDKTKPFAERYGPAHEIEVLAGGRLAGILATTGMVTVNSLHGQGIDRVAPGLVVEALAPDGTIEAVSAVDAPAFALGVQWHPEWGFADNPVSRKLFGAFAEAASRHATARQQVMARVA
jgi:putative glutamine amidotransferase